MRNFVVMLIVVLLFASCKEDEVITTSNLTVYFYGVNNVNPENLHIKLFSTEYPDVPLYENMHVPGDGKIVFKTLNAGTYLLKYNSLDCIWCEYTALLQLNEGKNKTIYIYNNGENDM